MSKRISNRAIWAILFASIVIILTGISTLEHGLNPQGQIVSSRNEPLAKPRQTLHEFFGTTAEAMWITGFAACIVSIVLTGFMGAESQKWTAEAKAAMEEAQYLIGRYQSKEKFHDANS